MGERLERIVPDTSVIIEGLLSRRISAGSIVPEVVIIHDAVVAELEHQANQNKSIGFLGLDELLRIRELSAKRDFKLEFAGLRPRPAEIRMASLGEIDSLIRDLAYEKDAVLFTADKVQNRVAQAKGLKTIFVEFERAESKLRLEGYFDSSTMSVHLRENVIPFAKKGAPGSWTFVAVGQSPLAREDIQDISREIIEASGSRRDGFIEIERPGSTIVQLGSFRIVITRPPFSDGWEITAVRPVKKLNLADYKLSERLMQRLSGQAEGLLIAGAPGQGKSTFAQALAEFYASQDKIVKTVEAPRDLVLPENITQLAISHGDSHEVHDILLLSRPDYTIFDEMRNTSDFKLFADLRLAGIGLAGVVHATNPIDSIQRFVGRIELGVIPQIIDTVIFIKAGFVNKVLSLSMTVKVPEGMTEADLARPVVVVNDFETKRLEYELYSYGEETVVIPVRAGAEKTPGKALAEKSIQQEFRNYVNNCRVDMLSEHKAVVYVPEPEIARVIGKQGKTIEQIEKKLGISIDIQPLEKAQPVADAAKELRFDAKFSKKHVVLQVDRGFAGKNVNILIDEDYVMTANVGKDGVVKITMKNKVGKMIADAVNLHENLRLVLA
ncbi:Flp pilus assembly complex ATPase component TadA [Candidatus Woesearchaeota archaeon]|nr:Flp pilus assembly complex ATPase component TadA [Candidatus Woesearchaeota archaeon]